MKGCVVAFPIAEGCRECDSVRPETAVEDSTALKLNYVFFSLQKDDHAFKWTK